MNSKGVFGLAIVAGVAFAVYRFVDFGPVDPLEKHRRAIRAVAMDVVSKSVDAAWTGTKLRFVVARFNDIADPKLACCKVAYGYKDGDANRTNQFRVIMVNKSTEEETIWAMRDIAVLNTPTVEQVLLEALIASLPEPTDRRRRAKPDLPPKKNDCAFLEGDWDLYRWLPYDAAKHKPAVQGRPVDDWIESTE